MRVPFGREVKKEGSRKRRKIKGEEKGFIYNIIKCKEYKEVNIGDTKFYLTKIIKMWNTQEKNAIAKQVVETGHKIDWIKAECLEKETWTCPSKIIEAICIMIFGDQVMNNMEELLLSRYYGGDLDRRERGG